MRSPIALVTVLMLVALMVGGAVLCSPAAFALERAGTVVAVRGKVEVDREGARSRLRVKDPIYVVDTIYTNNGRVQLMFSDHSLVSLGRNTVLTVSEYRYRPQAGEGALKTRVTEGVFRVVGGAITRLAPENFTTETPTATIGIRGSMYSGIYRNQTLSVLFEGGRGIFV
ncbi:MAG TPA: iron dicitrate transport regulator FecR, partial [Desulfobacterales bacterium]|nr:iron dicitrate transport regulator FecR [Desulfobacterales bacterium]